MMDYIKLKSKFTKEAIYWTIPWSVFILVLFQLLYYNIVIKQYLIIEINIVKLSWGSLLCLGLPMMYFHIMKIRHYILSDNYLRFYSIWHPFGRKLYWKNFIGKIETTETGRGGSYKVIYLVDKKNRTAFKLMGLHYKKFGELNNAIPLRKMDFSPTTGQYFKLMFFERIKITETGANFENEKKVVSAQKIIRIFALIGISLFVIGTIIKILIKLR
jgi:hypothetical protein